jgi:hypothetical protein
MQQDGSSKQASGQPQINPKDCGSHGKMQLKTVLSYVPIGEHLQASASGVTGCFMICHLPCETPTQSLAITVLRNSGKALRSLYGATSFLHPHIQPIS